MRDIPGDYQAMYDKAQTLAEREIGKREGATIKSGNKYKPSEESQVDRIAERRSYHLLIMVKMHCAASEGKAGETC